MRINPRKPKEMYAVCSQTVEQLVEPQWLTRAKLDQLQRGVKLQVLGGLLFFLGFWIYLLVYQSHNSEDRLMARWVIACTVGIFVTAVYFFFFRRVTK